MDQLMGLVTGLFTDPKATMYRAREEECRNATLLLAAVAIVAQALLMLINGVPFLIAIVLAVMNFVAFFLPCWLGGTMTGGTGGALDLLQLCGLVYLPLAVVSQLLGMAHLSVVVWIINWVLMYFLLMIGHNFNTFDDIKLAYVAGFVVSLVLMGVQKGVVHMLVRASLGG